MLLVIIPGIYFVREYGAQGMAVALLVGFLGQAVYMTLIIRKSINITFLGVLSRTKDAFEFVKRAVQAK